MRKHRKHFGGGGLVGKWTTAKQDTLKQGGAKGQEDSSPYGNVKDPRRGVVTGLAGGPLPEVARLLSTTTLALHQTVVCVGGGGVAEDVTCTWGGRKGPG